MEQIFPEIIKDKFYLECISLSRNSKQDKRRDERYGSVIVKNGAIIGRGFNRAISHPSFKLKRVVRQGWVNHAEIEALNDAFNNSDIDFVRGSELYVAGYFISSGELFFKREYTCNRCPPLLERYGINVLYTPTPSGWVKKSLDEAKEEAKEFFGNARQKRQKKKIGNYKIELLENII